MRTWEPVEITINEIDAADVIATSYNTTDTPLVGGSNSEDIMGNVGD